MYSYYIAVTVHIMYKMTDLCKYKMNSMQCKCTCHCVYKRNHPPSVQPYNKAISCELQLHALCHFKIQTKSPGNFRLLLQIFP